VKLACTCRKETGQSAIKYPVPLRPPPLLPGLYSLHAVDVAGCYKGHKAGKAHIAITILEEIAGERLDIGISQRRLDDIDVQHANQWRMEQ
jgi:hypothetical protein